MKELTRTRWVVLNGIPIKLADLPAVYQLALGNRVRTKPIESLGYILDAAVEVPKVVN